MNTTWWGRETAEPVLPGAAQPPLLLIEGRVGIRADVASRIVDFVPEWTNLREGDAGYALLKLHAELAEPLVQRLNRMPEKALIEFLRAAAVDPIPASPARAQLAFKTSDAAPGSVLVPEGFQVSAQGEDGRVIFETERTLYAAPGTIASSFVLEGSRAFEVDLEGSDEGEAVPALGDDPKPGSALLLGLDAKIEPRPSLTLWIQLAAESGAPPPIATGGVEPVTGSPRPFLRWEFLDGASYEQAEVIRDETNSLAQSGAIELKAPRRWRTGSPEGVITDQALRWLRLRVLFGEFSDPPALAFVRLNMVPAVAARTVREEVLEYIPGHDGRRLRLSQKPVRASSLKLVVNEGEINTPTGDAESDNGRVTWTEVGDLNASGPDDRHYELDAVAGEVQFGDGIHGTNLPRGFRHVIAEHYQVATGSAGAVEAEQITSLVSSAPFLVEVTNPLRASGGRDEESTEDALLRGPEQIRARDRAVTTADYVLMTLQVDGADIRRAHAVGGMDARLDGAEVPGTVSVLLVGPPQPEGPPYPDAGSLDAVSRKLTEKYAPAGVEVVAAAAQFHRIGVRASLVIAEDADEGTVIREALSALDTLFDPIEGGEQKRGWTFGETVQHDAVVRWLLAEVDDLLAVSELNLVVDGETLQACTDFETAAHHLLWPDIHELKIEEGNAS